VAVGQVIRYASPIPTAVFRLPRVRVSFRLNSCSFWNKIMMLRNNVENNTIEINVAIKDQITIAVRVETLKWLVLPSAAIAAIKTSSTAREMAMNSPATFTQRDPLVM
jgi:hypothetical protein